MLHPSGGSTFPLLVIYIVLIDPEKEMMRIATWWIITIVERPQSLRNRAAMPDDPCKTMGADLDRTTPLLKEIKLSIASPGKVPMPFPATIGAIGAMDAERNKIPESLLDVRT